MYSYQKILFNFSNIFFRHMWIANIRARNSKNASQASLLRNLRTPYLLTSWKLTKFDNCLIHFLCKKLFGLFVSEPENKYYTRHQKNPRFPTFFTYSFSLLKILVIFNCKLCLTSSLRNSFVVRVKLWLFKIYYNLSA